VVVADVPDIASQITAVDVQAAAAIAPGSLEPAYAVSGFTGAVIDRLAAVAALAGWQWLYSGFCDVGIHVLSSPCEH
jgi:hypothetical protein